MTQLKTTLLAKPARPVFCYFFSSIFASYQCHRGCNTSPKALSILHDAEVLFARGGAFLPEAVGLVTQKVVSALKQVPVVKYYVGFGPSRRLCAAAVPLPETGELFGPAEKQAAQDVYAVFKSFFDVNFPNYELTNCYSCLDLESDISWSQREALLRAIAVHEGLPPDACWLLNCIQKYFLYTDINC